MSDEISGPYRQSLSFWEKKAHQILSGAPRVSKSASKPISLSSSSSLESVKSDPQLSTNSSNSNNTTATQSPLKRRSSRSRDNNSVIISDKSSAESATSASSRDKSPRRERRHSINRSNDAVRPFTSSTPADPEDGSKPRSRQRSDTDTEPITSSSNNNNNSAKPQIIEKNKDPDPLLLEKIKYLEEKISKLREELDAERSARQALEAKMLEYEAGFTAMTEQFKRQIEQISKLTDDISSIKRWQDNVEEKYLALKIGGHEDSTSTTTIDKEPVLVNLDSEALQVKSADATSIAPDASAPSTETTETLLSTSSTESAVETKAFGKRSKSARELSITQRLQDNKTGDDIAEATARKGSHSSVDVGKRKHKSEKSKHRSREVSQNLDSEKKRHSIQFKSLPASPQLSAARIDRIAKSKSKPKLDEVEGYYSESRIQLKKSSSKRKSRSRSLKHKEVQDATENNENAASNATTNTTNPDTTANISTNTPKQMRRQNTVSTSGEREHSMSSPRESSSESALFSPRATTTNRDQKSPAPPKFNLATDTDPDGDMIAKKPRRRSSINIAELIKDVEFASSFRDYTKSGSVSVRDDRSREDVRQKHKSSDRERSSVNFRQAASPPRSKRNEDKHSKRYIISPRTTDRYPTGDDMGHSSDSESVDSRSSRHSSVLDSEAIDKKLKSKGLTKRDLLDSSTNRRRSASVGLSDVPLIDNDQEKKAAKGTHDTSKKEREDGHRPSDEDRHSESSQGDDKKAIIKKFNLLGSTARVFGVPLQHTPLDESSIPIILTQLCSHLRQESLLPPDLFDRPVEQYKIESLQKRMESVQNPLKDQNPYVVAALLKHFFIELPDCLFMNSKYKYWIEALEIEDDPIRVPFLRSLVHSLDRVNRKVLYYMLTFFKHLSDREPHTFTPGKFGVTFGPLFLRSKPRESILFEVSAEEKELEDEVHNENAALLLGLLIKYQAEIFPYKLEGLEFHRKNHYVKAATIDNFVILLLDPNYGEKDFPHIFWTTSVYFVKNDDLLQRLINLYRLYSGPTKWEHRMRIKVLMTIKLWVQKYATVLSKDDSFQALLKEFSEEARQLASVDPELQLINSLHYAPPPEREEDTQLRRRLLALANIREGEPQLDINRYDARTVANQLSLLSHRLIALLDFSELINGAPKDPQRSMTFTALVNFINRITNWVAYEIVSRCNNVHERARMLSYFIEVAKICTESYDFNTASAVFGAFGQHNVSRLTQTWEKLSRKDVSRHKKLTVLFNPRMNFSEYRKALDRAMADTGAIPILAFLPKDITRYEEDPTYTEDKLVDFEKMRGIYNTLQTLVVCKTEMFPFTKNDELWDFFLTIPSVSEERMEELSHKAEPKR